MVALQKLETEDVELREEIKSRVEQRSGVDERVSLDGLRFGLPVLYDVVRRYCG